MAIINDFRKYLDYEFSSEVYTGEDYLTFQTKYLNYLRGMCKTNGWQLVSFMGCHYFFSAFIKSGGKYVYVAISDVRYCKNRWYNAILIRTAKNERDYYGDWNNYTTLPELQPAIARFLKEETV